MQVVKRILTTISLILMFSFIVLAQNQDDNKDNKRRVLQPTVTGATGLFTVFDSSTLKHGEFNLGFFANNYDRDPGDVDIMQFPVNIAAGVTNRLEVFLNTDGYQRLNSNAPFELSGPLFPGLSQRPGQFIFEGIKTRFPGIKNTNPRFFPLNGSPVSGALVGGLLPGLPQTGTQFVFDPVLGVNKPGFQVPGYLNDFPFLGRGGGTLGNITFGAKFRLNNPDSNNGIAVLAYARVPTVSTNALLTKDRGGRITMGSGAGASDFALYLIASHCFPKFAAHAHFNFGYIHANDPQTRDIKVLDRSDSLVFAGGLDLPIGKYIQLIGEGTYQFYIGDATTDLNRVNPGDIVAGARFYPFGKSESKRFIFSFGGGYRYFINNSGSERDKRIDEILANFSSATFSDGGGFIFGRGGDGHGHHGHEPPPIPTINPIGFDLRALQRSRDSDYNGFVANITFGVRKRILPLAPATCDCNVPPTVTVTQDKVKIKPGEKVNLIASATSNNTTSATNTKESFSFSWSASQGALSGNDTMMSWDSANLPPGVYKIYVKAEETVNCQVPATTFNGCIDQRITRDLSSKCPVGEAKAVEIEIAQNLCPELVSTEVKVDGTRVGTMTFGSSAGTAFEIRLPDETSRKTIGLSVSATHPLQETINYRWSATIDGNPFGNFPNSNSVSFDTNATALKDALDRINDQNTPVKVIVTVMIGDQHPSHDNDPCPMATAAFNFYRDIRKSKTVCCPVQDFDTAPAAEGILYYSPKQTHLINPCQLVLDIVADQLQDRKVSVIVEGLAESGEGDAIARARRTQAYEYLVNNKKVDKAQVIDKDKGNERSNYQVEGSGAGQRGIRATIVRPGETRDVITLKFTDYNLTDKEFNTEVTPYARNTVNPTDNPVAGRGNEAAKETYYARARLNVLDYIVKQVQMRRVQSIDLVGYSSSDESKGTARRRAEAVRDYLKSKLGSDSMIKINAKDHDTTYTQKKETHRNRRVGIGITFQ